MNTTVITPSAPNCYGVCCPRHGECVRYQAVHGAQGHQPTIGSCDLDGRGGRPLFVLVEVAV